MQLVYIDSSLALRAILPCNERDQLRIWFSRPDLSFISSRLLRTEIIRTLRRENLPLSDATPLLERVGLLEILPATHSIAESFESHIKTLDALHIASALSLGHQVVLASHDKQMLKVAAIVGLQTHDPIG